ncbi:GtrA family protein [Corynebacterium pseudokroppenstedtii]|uniref:GtrA family protein n=1 Tax=Corynebacterium pseudokroppenstedtii TaxID=2804917 RepID=A0AAU0PXC5_9CORY|nr:GtrA family protein [Corynebacterium pseudokroppenstedtii]MDU6478305.1 GtrA family protein [Corynebacterium kroppenstedtii]MCF6792967.1 GtrA family protein [Corynebacterium pseudokroppenstedtii]MCF8702238.1 GtrA family protein [Corynebacterium pseudokroppenstedtii]MCG2635619.1 GtrA family protein [Corynebacterium pseudokroppenstedtii]MDK7146643.1 GtrA family protein [Corynebacterium pseudokroppenstedtii]
MSETKPDHPTDDHAEPELLTPNLSGALAAESAAMDDVDAATESGATATDASASADTATPGTAGVDAPAPQGASVLTHLYKFVIAGGISAVVDYGLTMIIQHAFGQSYPLAKAIGFIFGTITAYIINRRWTFEAEPSAKKFLQTMSLYALMFAVQWGLAVSVNHLLLNAGASAFIAGTVGYVIGQGVATAVNFVVQRWVIFKTN